MIYHPAFRVFNNSALIENRIISQLKVQYHTKVKLRINLDMNEF